jgi:hypothetical protein
MKTILYRLSFFSHLVNNFIYLAIIATKTIAN